MLAGLRQLSNPGRGFSSSLVVQHAKKSPYLRTSSSLNMAVRGGLTRFARPAGSLFATLSVCPTGCRQLSTPGRGFLSPPVGASYPPWWGGATCKKKPAFSCELFFKYGGEGGLTRFARPTGSLFATLSVCPAGCASCRTPVGDSHPPAGVQHAKKKPAFSCELFLKYGGEGGIRTPDTLPYTHFPGVLLQPLGHLTILFCCSPWVGNGALL